MQHKLDRALILNIKLKNNNKTVYNNGQSIRCKKKIIQKTLPWNFSIKLFQPPPWVGIGFALKKNFPVTPRLWNSYLKLNFLYKDLGWLYYLDKQFLEIKFLIKDDNLCFSTKNKQAMLLYLL